MEKPIKVAICVCAYASADLISEFWRTLRPAFNEFDEIMETPLYPKMEPVLHLFNHGVWDDVNDACTAIAAEDTRIRFHNYRKNRGLSVSWNEAANMAYRFELESHADILIYANDDIEWGPNTLLALATAGANADPDTYMITAVGDHLVNGKNQSFGHSLFGYTRHAWQRLGAWDENFQPAFCEDQDMDIRARAAGMKQIGVPVDAKHIGSATSRGRSIDPVRRAEIREQTDLTHPANRVYLRQKWGYDLDKPYETPFNERARDPKRPWYIRPVDAYDPYPAHSRSTEFARTVKI
jgi:GT2 family glycosyltransferase